MYLSYGKSSNAYLLLNYGFSYMNNPYEYVEVKHLKWFFILKKDMLNVNFLASIRGAVQIGDNELQAMA